MGPIGLRIRQTAAAARGAPCRFIRAARKQCDSHCNTALQQRLHACIALAVLVPSSRRAGIGDGMVDCGWNTRALGVPGRWCCSAEEASRGRCCGLHQQFVSGSPAARFHAWLALLRTRRGKVYRF